MSVSVDAMDRHIDSESMLADTTSARTIWSDLEYNMNNLTPGVQLASTPGEHSRTFKESSQTGTRSVDIDALNDSHQLSVNEWIATNPTCVTGSLVGQQYRDLPTISANVTGCNAVLPRVFPFPAPYPIPEYASWIASSGLVGGDLNLRNYLLQGSAMRGHSSGFISNTPKYDHNLDRHKSPHVRAQDLAIGVGVASRAMPCQSEDSELLPSDPERCYYTCSRRADQGTCNAKMSSSEFSAHPRSCHVAAIPRDAKLTCRSEPSQAGMRSVDVDALNSSHQLVSVSEWTATNPSRAAGSLVDQQYRDLPAMSPNLIGGSTVTILPSLDFPSLAPSPIQEYFPRQGHALSALMVEDLNLRKYLPQEPEFASQGHISNAPEPGHDLQVDWQESSHVRINPVQDPAIGVSVPSQAAPCQSKELSPSDPEHGYHTCSWEAGHGACNAKIPSSEFSTHLRSCHVATISRDAKLTCRWVGCSMKLRKGNLLRHIREKHLEREFPCPMCPQRFTRNHTRRIHLLKRHGWN